MADTIKVRTTMTPWKETELKGGEREREQLANLGLIYEGNATTESGLIESAAKQVVKRRGGQTAPGGEPDASGQEPAGGNDENATG